MSKSMGETTKTEIDWESKDITAFRKIRDRLSRRIAELEDPGAFCVVQVCGECYKDSCSKRKDSPEDFIDIVYR